MAILPGSPEPIYFAPIPETLACHVSGGAKDERGEPVAGARVTLYAVSQDGPKPAATTTTDAQGLYEFRGVRLPVQASNRQFSYLNMLPRIQFLVSGEAPGKGVAWRQGWSMWQFNTVNLVGNGGEGHLFLHSDVTLDLTFGKAASLHGKIVDEDGKPVPGATVRVVNYAEIGADGREKGEFLGFDWSASPQEIGRARAGADGGFRIEGLTESVCYSLVATRPEAPRTEFSLFAVTVDGPAQEHGPRSYGSIVMGGHTALANPVAITLPRLRPVEVSVVGEDDGKPVAAAHIKVVGAATVEGETDAEGKLRLDLPPSENVSFYSTPPEHSRYLPTYPDHLLAVEAGDAPMPLEIRQKVGAELILEAVEAGTGKPVPDVFFWWTIEGGVEPENRTSDDVSSVLLRAWTDEGGVLRVAVAPAPGRRYRFHFGGMREPVTSDFSPGSPRTYGYEATPAESEPVELVPGKPVRLKFELRKGPPDPNPYRPRVRVSGAARDERGRAVAGAKVTLREITKEGARPIAVAEADAEGRYEFRDASVPVRSPTPASKPRAALIVSGEAPGKRIAWSEPRLVNAIKVPRPDASVGLDLTFVGSSALRFKAELFDAEGRPTGDIPLYDRR
jgi:protocatechuate 3,4-dioxygenase beta subunit